MELVTLAHVRKMRERDPDTGEFTNTLGYQRLFAQHVLLYDPSGEDGEGNPMTSYILASQALEALDKGFTEEPPKKPKKAK